MNTNHVRTDVARELNAVITEIEPPLPPTGLSGPMSGLRVGIKDNIDVAGVPTTAASRFLAGNIPQRDAEVVRLLRASGATITAKLNMAEFALGVTSQNSAAGPCRNPWDLRRIPGGSSGGSGAAVAAGLVDVALGTDTGGSVRLPAAMTGVTGLRPTSGLVSNDAVVPLCPLLDTVGPLARTVDLVARTFRVLSKASHSALPSPAVPRRVGVPRQFFDGVDDGVASKVRAAADDFAAGGAELIDVQMSGVSEAQDIIYTLVYWDVVTAHEERIREEAAMFHPDTLERMRQGLTLTLDDHARAMSARGRLHRALDAIFEHVDILLSPTLPIDVPVATPGKIVEVSRRIASFTHPWSLYNGPTLAIPVGPHPRSGMPVGMQLTAAPEEEDMLFAAGSWYQQRRSWHELRPPLAVV